MSKPILEEAKRCFERARQLPYPDGLAVGAWWAERQRATLERIGRFESAVETIQYAQAENVSGFDHRIADRVVGHTIANFKIKELERLFPAWSWEKGSVHESPHSINESIVTIAGIPCSSIFLTHVNFYLRSTEALIRAGGEPRTVVEIGGGYGALARVFKLAHPETTYVIVDLPESLFYAHIFLASNFPEAKIGYVVDAHAPCGLSSFDFLLVPAQACEAIKGATVDVVINTGSLQEMPSAAVAFWMTFIQTVVDTRFFYSFNYFLLNKKEFCETSRQESNLICPVLDPWWRVHHFAINPAVITVDADKRNWLEVCVERHRAGDQTREERAGELFRAAQAFPKGSNYWFKDVWMAVWCDPREEHVRAMIEGIELFRDEIHAAVPVNYVRSPSLSAKSKVKNTIKRLFFTHRHLAYDMNEFSELDYYGDLSHRSG